MKRISRIACLILFIALLLGPSFTVRGEVPKQTTGLIAEGTPWETPYRIHDSGRPGPTVLVTAGVHGNELAGILATEQVVDWPLEQGRLIVIPRCNQPSRKANVRNLPGAPPGQENLNRNFPAAKNDLTPVGEPAGVLWEFIERHRPDYVLDLHEGYGFRAAGSKSVGSSVIRTEHTQAADLQAKILAAVNGRIDEEDHRFVPIEHAAEGSLARSCFERLGSCALTLETTTAEQALAKRVGQHRLAVHTVLSDLEMTSASPWDLLPPDRPAPETIYVARYNGPGAGYNDLPDHFEKILDPEKEIILRRIGPEEVVQGLLDRFDVLIMPGGSGSAQAKGLGPEGREKIKRFVENGGGYIGICAGAYLATANYDWSLGVIDADSVDREHWRRGTGPVRLGLPEAGKTLLQCPHDEVEVRFGQGPMLAPAGRDDLPDYEVLAWYRSGIGKNGADPQTMVDKPALVAGTFGRGRVVVISPHPEQTDGLRPWLLHAVRYVAGRR